MRHVLLVLVAVLCVGCVTNDFKVVDALKPGLTPAEAGQIIASYGFQRYVAQDRPAEGWSKTPGTLSNLQPRAANAEQRLNQPVTRAELYPVGHGLFGAGQLYLFYGPDGRLLEFYRHQIN